MGDPKPICCKRCDKPIGYYVVIHWAGPEYRCLSCKFDDSKIQSLEKVE